VEEFSRKADQDLHNSDENDAENIVGNSMHVMPQEESEESDIEDEDEDENLHNIDLDNNENNDEFYAGGAREDDDDLQSELHSLLQNASSLMTMPRDKSAELEDSNTSAKVTRKTVTFADDTVPGNSSPRCTSPLLNADHKEDKNYEMPEIL
jgi:hypothetical protein